MEAEDGKMRETDAIIKNARKELESKTGKSVVTGENFLPSTKEKKKINN